MLVGAGSMRKIEAWVKIHVVGWQVRDILIQLVGKPAGIRNVGPRDMFVARLERRQFLTQANMGM